MVTAEQIDLVLAEYGQKVMAVDGQPLPDENEFFQELKRTTTGRRIITASITESMVGGVPAIVTCLTTAMYIGYLLGRAEKTQAQEVEELKKLMS